MAKTRLNMRHREVLRHFASENIVCDVEQKARDKAYAKASKLVRSAVETRFPVRDMEVLKKYSVAEPDKCINGGTPAGNFIRFNFDTDDESPLCPSRYCSSRSISFNQNTVDAIQALEKASNELEKAKSEKYTAYRSLIASCVTFEELIEVWPAAEALRDRICAQSTAVIALSDDLREFIKNDNAGSEAIAA